MCDLLKGVIYALDGLHINLGKHCRNWECRGSDTVVLWYGIVEFNIPLDTV